MRILLGISVAAVVAAFVWSNLPTQAKQQFDGISTDPLATTDTDRVLLKIRCSLNPYLCPMIINSNSTDPENQPHAASVR